MQIHGDVTPPHAPLLYDAVPTHTPALTQPNSGVCTAPRPSCRLRLEAAPRHCDAPRLASAAIPPRPSLHLGILAALSTNTTRYKNTHTTGKR